MFDIEKIKKFSTKPGVYIMKNDKGAVLYVGKAKNIQQRVKQYFLKNGDSRTMVPFLISKISEIDTIVVNSEKEAFLLENTLIKRHKPKFNILLKDDKTYIALKVNNKHAWPMVQIVRYRGKPKADGLYFGPYSSAFAARATLDLLNKVFPLRQCSDNELIRRTRPCILYGMKRCIAPCVNLCTKEEYFNHVNHVIKFLRGNDKEVVKELYEEMSKYSDKLEFEKAQRVLETILQIEKTIEKQSVDKPLGLDSDAIGIYREGDEISLSQMFFRGGKLIGSSNFHFNHIAQEDHEILTSFILQQYQIQETYPHEILLPIKCQDLEALEEILSENHVRKVRILVPERGSKVLMTNIAKENAEATFKKDKDQKAIRERILMEMQEKFHLSKYPQRIECFDNSNINGTNPVSCMVAFTDGEKDGKRYRKFKIKTVGDTPDDYASMEEVLTRRYLKAKLENDLPDLVIIDGGKGHLNMAIKIFSKLDIIGVDLIGLAKEAGRHDKGMTSEQVFLPNIKDPIFLKKNSPILFLLQRIRDEAHRSAITFHRSKRQKNTLKSSLDEIPGIGEVKKKKLLIHFGSVNKIKNASEEELLEVKGITKQNALMIHNFFNPSK